MCFLSVGNQAHQIVRDPGGKQEKVLQSFPSTEPNIQIKSLSDNPTKDFLEFQIINKNSGNELFRFRIKNIVECRKFMTSLGGTGDGLFTKKSETDDEFIKASQDVIIQLKVNCLTNKMLMKSMTRTYINLQTAVIPTWQVSHLHTQKRYNS